MKKIIEKAIIGIAGVMIICAGCSTAKKANNTQKGAAIGAASGAVIGGVIGNNVGNGKNTAFNSTSQQSIATNFELELPSSICIKIYDATGRLIKTLTDNKMQQGSYQLQWDSKDEVGKAVPAGIYVLQFFTNSKSEVRKLSLL